MRSYGKRRKAFDMCLQSKSCEKNIRKNKRFNWCANCIFRHSKCEKCGRKAFGCAIWSARTAVPLSAWLVVKEVCNSGGRSYATVVRCCVRNCSPQDPVSVLPTSRLPPSTTWSDIQRLRASGFYCRYRSSVAARPFQGEGLLEGLPHR